MVEKISSPIRRRRENKSSANILVVYLDDLKVVVLLLNFGSWQFWRLWRVRRMMWTPRANVKWYDPSQSVQ